MVIGACTCHVRLAVRFRTAVSGLPRSVSFKKWYRVIGVGSMDKKDDLLQAVADYVPRSMSSDDWARVRDFTRDVTNRHVLPSEPDRATLRLIMLAVAQAAHVTVTQVGGELTVTDVFDPLVVEYVVSQTDLTDRAKSVRRALLYRLGRELNPNWPFDDRTTKYGYKAPDAPYSDQEQRLLAQWAGGLSTDYQRTGATLTLALGLGAGLRAGEMARLRGSDVAHHADGCVTVTAHGHRNLPPREIPVLAAWENVVLSACDVTKGKGLLLWPNRQHATTESVAAILTRIGKPHAVALDTRRLRTTWIVSHMQAHVPESVICQAAGLSDLQHFSQWHATAPMPTEHARALLRRAAYPRLRVAD